MPQPDHDDDPQWRTTINLMAVIALLVLFGVGYFVLEGLNTSRRAQMCIEAGRRTCGEFTRVN